MDQVTISTISRVESYLKKASLVEVTVNVDIFVKVPLFLRASLAETSLSDGNEEDTTVLGTSSREAPISSKVSLVSTIATIKEWKKLQRCFFTGEDPGLRLKATPKGPVRTAQREIRSRT